MVYDVVHSSNSDAHHLPPDPTLTVENMNCVMAKVEPKEREKVYWEVRDYDAMMKIQEQYSTDSEREVAYVDVYVNCDSRSSWQSLAKVLYRRHHVAAVEEVRSYLPPRGVSPCTCVVCILQVQCRYLVVSHHNSYSVCCWHACKQPSLSPSDPC